MTPDLKGLAFVTFILFILWAGLIYFQLSMICHYLKELYSQVSRMAATIEMGKYK